jgi:hypothetical protein
LLSSMSISKDELDGWSRTKPIIHDGGGFRKEFGPSCGALTQKRVEESPLKRKLRSTSGSAAVSHTLFQDVLTP